MALRGEGFHAVPPPSSLTGQHEQAPHGSPHEHALHGPPPHEHALHGPPHEHVPHDALVPAHDALVPAENRPQWVDLPHGEVGRGEMRGRVHEMPSMFPQRPLTIDEKEEMMLQQALGRLSQPSLPIDVDGPGMIEDLRGALPAGVPPLPVRAQQAEHAMRPEQAPSSSTPRQVPAAGSDGRDAEGPFSPQPANYQQTVCQHERVTARGTNKFYRILRCLDCQLLLERERIPQVSLPKGQPASRGPTTAVEERQAPGCYHHRVSWRGTNGHTWQKTCLDCGFKQSGPVNPDAQTSPVDSFQTPQSRTSNLADFLGGELTAEEAAGAVRSFENAVEMKLMQLGPGDTINSRTLIEALALSLRLAEVWHGEPPSQGSDASQPPSSVRTPIYAPARADPVTHQGTRRVLRERAVLHVGAGKYKNNPCGCWRRLTTSRQERCDP